MDEPKVGTISGRLEQNQYGYKPGSKVYAGKNWGWQSEESYKKTVEKRKGAVFYNFIGSGLNHLKSFVRPAAPLIKPVVQAAAPVLDAAAGIIDSTPVIGDVSRQISEATTYLEDQAVQAGFDRRAGTSAAMLVEEVATAGLSKGASSVAKGITKLPPPPRLSPVAVGGRISLQSPPIQPHRKGGPVFEAVTVKDPEILELGGVKRGDDIISPAQAKQLTYRAGKVQKYIEKIQNKREKLLELEEFGGDLKEIEHLKKSIDADRVMLHRNRSNVSVPTKEDPLYYSSTASKAQKRIDEDILGLPADEYLEEHHLFPKVVSAAFYDKMDDFIRKGLAEQDDLVLMNEIAIKLGRKPGDYKSGMLNMRKGPHNELHTAMRYSGDEMNEVKWAKLVSQAKDANELLRLWRDTLINNVIPTANDAISINKLDDVLADIE